jgi:hypothetical protein
MDEKKDDRNHQPDHGQRVEQAKREVAKHFVVAYSSFVPSPFGSGQAPSSCGSGQAVGRQPFVTSGAETRTCLQQLFGTSKLVPFPFRWLPEIPHSLP